MLSIPTRWGELYFNILTILCLAEWVFLVWYKIMRRGLASDYIDVTMDAIIGIGAVGLAAAVQAFVILKVRDAIMVTWETFSQRRFEMGKEEGIEIGVERGKRQTLHTIESLLNESNGAHIPKADDENHDLEELLARIQRDPAALEKLRAMIREEKTDETG